MKPERSVTGFPTVNVSPSARDALIRKLSVRGMTIHSSEASTVWAVTDHCRSAHIPYEVKVARDAQGKVMGVSVQRTDVFIDQSIPPDWTIEVVDRYFGLG